jgi:hypothetical protein
MHEALESFFATLPITSPRLPLYSCATTQTYPDQPKAIRELVLEQWVRPVRFRETVLQM